MSMKSHSVCKPSNISCENTQCVFIKTPRNSQYIASVMITAEGNNDQLIITMANLGLDWAQPAGALQLVWTLTI